MSVPFTVVFQSVVSFIEMCLVYYLYSNKLKLRTPKWLICNCFLLEYALILFMTFTVSDFGMRLLFITIVFILFSFIVSISDVTSTLFWGSIYIVVIIFADSITFLLGSILTGVSAAEFLFSTQMGNLLSLIYLLICFCCVYLLTHWNSGLFVFPWYVPFLYLGLVFLGSGMVESLLELLLNMGKKDPFIERIIYSAIGCIFLSLFLILFLLHRVGRLYQKNIELTEQTRQQQFEQQQYELICNANQLLRGWKHDQRQFLSALKLLLQDQKYKDGLELIDSMDENLCIGAWKIHTGNTAIDAVLSMKLSTVAQNNIHFTHSIFLPENPPLTNLEWASLLGNLMDNAICACQQVANPANRYIELEIKPQQQFLSVRIKNSSAGKYHFGTAGQFLSTKPQPGHGIGLKRVEQIVTQDGGFFDIQAASDSFEVTIALNPKDKKTTENTKEQDAL